VESFHLHLATFIPETAANAINFQAYLLEGIMRWSSPRAAEAVACQKGNLRSFNIQLKNNVNNKQTFQCHKNVLNSQ
jgi:hypothetical protein